MIKPFRCSPRISLLALALGGALQVRGQPPPPDQNAIITVVFSNDVHGGIDRTAARFMNDEFPPPLGGGASAAQLILGLRSAAQERGEGFLLLDAGDIFSGTLIGSQDSGRTVVDYMNAVGYDAMTIGNHEFDLGRENLKDLVSRANFPVLSANIFSDSTGKIADFAKSYIIKEVAGIRVGIVGLTTYGTPRASFSEHISGLRFGDEVEAARRAIAGAKKDGAEVIIGLVHLGLPYSWEDGYARLQEREREGFPGTGAANAMELARRVPEFEVIFCGDIHVGYRQPWVDPVTHVPCFQNYGRGTGIGLVQLELDRESGSLIGWKTLADDGTLVTLFSDEFPPDPAVDQLIREKAERLAAVYEQAIGYTVTSISRSGEAESPLGNLVTDAWREQFGADLALTNTGGLRDDLPSGEITLQEIFNVLPFSNSLVLMQIRGEFFRKLLEDKVTSERLGFALSGARLLVDFNQPEGQRIQSLTVSGEPLDPEKTYTLVTTEYLREGNSRFEALAAVPDDQVSSSGVLDREALAQYVVRAKEIGAIMDGRIKVIFPGR